MLEPPARGGEVGRLNLVAFSLRKDILCIMLGRQDRNLGTISTYLRFTLNKIQHPLPLLRRRLSERRMTDMSGCRNFGFERLTGDRVSSPPRCALK
jgi:hypothetical protein